MYCITLRQKLSNTKVDGKIIFDNGNSRWKNTLNLRSTYLLVRKLLTISESPQRQFEFAQMPWNCRCLDFHATNLMILYAVTFLSQHFFDFAIVNILNLCVFIWLYVSDSEESWLWRSWLTEKDLSLTKHNFPWSQAASRVWQHSHLSV